VGVQVGQRGMAELEGRVQLQELPHQEVNPEVVVVEITMEPVALAAMAK